MWTCTNCTFAENSDSAESCALCAAQHIQVAETKTSDEKELEDFVCKMSKSVEQYGFVAPITQQDIKRVIADDAKSFPLLNDHFSEKVAAILRGSINTNQPYLAMDLFHAAMAANDNYLDLMKRDRFNFSLPERVRNAMSLQIKVIEASSSARLLQLFKVLLTLGSRECAPVAVTPPPVEQKTSTPSVLASTTLPKILDDDEFRSTLLTPLKSSSFDSGRNNILQDVCQFDVHISAGQLIQVLTQYSFDSGRTQAINVLVTNNCIATKLTRGDLLQVLALHSFDSGKNASLELLAKNGCIGKFPVPAECFSFDSGRSQAASILARYRSECGAEIVQHEKTAPRPRTDDDDMDSATDDGNVFISNGGVCVIGADGELVVSAGGYANVKMKLF